MFNSDKRSKKIILVANCILNQNIKLDQLATYGGVVIPVVSEIMNAEIGILQLPCPEMLGIGLDRQTALKNPQSTDIGDEKTRVAKLMNQDTQIELCNTLISNVITQIQQYVKNGFSIIGVLGVNMSPTCGIETTWHDNQEVSGYGIFMKTLKTELEKMKIPLAFQGIKPNEIETSVTSVKQLIFHTNNKEPHVAK